MGMCSGLHGGPPSKDMSMSNEPVNVQFLWKSVFADITKDLEIILGYLGGL